MLRTPPEFREWLCSRGNSNNPIITDQQDVSSAIAQSPFYRLPLEIRLYILRLAFGGRTLHIGDLSFYDPDRNDKTWWSCVCDRDANRDVTKDMCYEVYRGRWKSSSCHPTEIGVVGWLYSCRLGYIEASHVLYSTNTFHSDGAAALNIDVLFPSNRLAKIPGLEISYNLNILAPSGWDNSIKKGAKTQLLNDLLSNIANSFHSLRSLRLSIVFAVNYQRGKPKLDIIDGCLDRVDEIICQRIQGVKVEIVLDQKSFCDLWNEPEGYARCNYLHVGHFRKLRRKRKDRDSEILLSKDPGLLAIT